MTHPASVPHSSPQKTPASDREVAVSKPMQKAFIELEKIKRKGDLKLLTFYATQENSLQGIIGKQWNPNTGVTKTILEGIDKWSIATAEGRNAIIEQTYAEARLVGTRYLSAEMIIAWGVVDPSVKQLAAQNLFDTMKANLNKGTGESRSKLSANWWKNGFSQKHGRKRLLNSLAQNTLLFRDAVKAGTDLVNTGQINFKKGKLPKYINDLIKLSKDSSRAGKAQFRKEFDKALRHVKGLRGNIISTPDGQQRELLTRAGKKRILSAIKKFAVSGSRADLRASIKKYNLDQAYFNARTLQRSVTNDAFQTEVREWGEQNQEMVDFVAWMLAPVRNFLDVCDEYAERKWKATEVPLYPHYNCACTIQPILVDADEYFKLLASREAA